MRILPIYNTVILPKVKYQLGVELLSEEETKGLKDEEHVLLLPMKEWKERSELQQEDFYSIGVIADVKAVKDEQQGTVIVVEAKERADVRSLTIENDKMQAAFKLRPETADIPDEEVDNLLNDIKNKLIEVSSQYQWGPWVNQWIKNWKSMEEVVSSVGPYLALSEEEKYALLKTDSSRERVNLIKEAVLQMKESLDVRADVTKKMQDEQNSTYRKAAIQKQMDLLQKELDEMDPDAISEEQALYEKIISCEMPKETEKEVLRVYNRFKQEGKNGHEYSSLYDYLDFVTSLSWKDSKQNKIDISKARKILDEDHYGLTKIKERILQHMAVMSLRKQQSGSILLFVGAPGTGKTSMGKSIAKALDREYVRISLGGVRDESEIRGHRRTYIGAMPGRIMEGMKRSGAKNPVMVLDEIDKLSSSYNGDPASALLEVLDPEQNDTFTDHYMNVEYDLSNVFFVCTANTLDGIPGPLLDRMEIIQLSGYTPVEKFYIGKEHLLKKALSDAGLQKSNFSISDKVLKKLIEDYTMEAGVRGLKKQLDRLCRQAAVQLSQEKKKKVIIKEKDLAEYLGRKIAAHDKKLKKSTPGIVTGLAWTQAGGDILFIETAVMRGTGRIHVTGQLGDVMKESAEIAVSLLKSVFYHEELKLDDKDIHIHVPSGAVPKDGPSAGVTLFTALTSLITQTSVDENLAMTGEISLQGRVLPIGGLPEKLMAAERSGIKKVLIPIENQEDLKDVPQEIKEKLEIVPVETVQEVIFHALHMELPKNRKYMFFETADSKAC